jgi:hypothetical protein
MEMTIVPKTIYRGNAVDSKSPHHSSQNYVLENKGHPFVLAPNCVSVTPSMGDKHSS